MTKCNIDDLTVGQIKEIERMTRPMKTLEVQEKNFQVGENVLIRTVTFYWAGTATKETDKFVTLSPCACIYDTGRFSEALNTGKLREIEVPKGSARIGIGAIVDCEEWSHAIPTVTK